MQIFFSRRKNQKSILGYRHNSGVSLVELLLVIAIVSILGSVSVSFGAGFVRRNSVKNSVNELTSSLRIAQLNSATSKANQKWGVQVTSGEIIVFAQNDANLNISYSIPPNVSVTEDTVVFDNLTGDPDFATSFIISGAGQSVRVDVNEVGVVNIN